MAEAGGSLKGLGVGAHGGCEAMLLDGLDARKKGCYLEP